MAERVHPAWDILTKKLHDPVQQMVDLGYDRDVLRAVIEDEQHSERGVFAVLAALNGIDLFEVSMVLDVSGLDESLFPGLFKKDTP